MLPIPKAILFDLDGTLLDTAPDMAAALNRLRAEQGLEPMPFDQIRPHVSNGARGLLGIGLKITPEAADYPRLRERFLTLYAEDLAVHTCLFPGLEALVESLEGRDLPWGVVTNKPGGLTHQLLEALSLEPAVVVCGDELERAKPHPDPLLFAAGKLRLAPVDIWYIGDHERDIIAGNAAHMPTIAGRWGYLDGERPIEDWGASVVIDTPEEIAGLLETNNPHEASA
ncbi:HAD hydrolase-like protein [Guyparkeria hydrothermalis]|uniref:HAD hydrolase-like protein n=1 Tax=Guyparkeria hydrothermalis TaxID=923 RepID=UPI002020EFC4|nr:HAD hydrolase-like protein [Guyparkeria hydrothermalis]MCL7743499.1 HAD hydrolase-like protein [Guyparkeria hydrothermalis]